jgi:hypothetical protein
MKKHRMGQRRLLNIYVILIFMAFQANSLIAQSSHTTPVNFKVAFVGDQGVKPKSREVLNLIKSEGAQAMVYLGDIDYIDDPAAWNTMINEIVGPDFPIFVVIGNHDTNRWDAPDGYQQLIKDRLTRLGITWEGDLGVQSTIRYNGLLLVQTAPGIKGKESNFGTYIKDKLASDNSIWKICSWHKNMRLMQVSGKVDETGWEVYEEARKGGAIIATAHSHTYSRTPLLSNIMNQTVASQSDTLVLTKGTTFVFVSGMGGQSKYAQELSGDWWASIYTKNQGAGFGALFGTFNVNGIPNMATFYFKDLKGVVADSFVVVSQVQDLAPLPPENLVAIPGNGKVTLQWNANSEEDFLRYIIYGDTSPNPTTKLDSTVSITDTTKIVSGLTNGTLYYFRITALDSNLNESDYSNEVSVTPVNSPPVIVQTISDTVLVEDSGEHVIVPDLTTVFVDTVDNEVLTFSVQSENVNILASIRDSVKLLVGSTKDFFGSDNIVVTASDGFNSVSDTFAVTITPVNDAPVVLEIPEIVFPEDSSFGIDLDAFVMDVDNDTTQISWMADFPTNTLAMLHEQINNKLKNQEYRLIGRRIKTSLKESGFSPFVPKTNWELGIAQGQNDSLIIKIDNLTHVVTITATSNFNGSDIPIFFTATDDSGASSSDTTTISVLPVNDPPVVISQIPDTTIVEDDDALILPNLNLYFEDVVEKSPLTYTAVSENIGIKVFTEDNLKLIMEPEPNFNGSSKITVEATDPEGQAARDTFVVNVLPVNDPPEVFNLISPANKSTVDSLEVTFLWNKANDVDGDKLEYTLFLYNTDIDTSFSSIPDTLFVLGGNDVLDYNAVYIWYVTASDRELTAQSLQTYIFRTPSITDIGKTSNEIPTQFNLHQNYPNPFNATTTIRFELPYASEVLLIVYNLLGKKVKTLRNGKLNAGYHSVRWDGKNDFGHSVATGMFFYKIVARSSKGSFSKVMKLILSK